MVVWTEKTQDRHSNGWLPMVLAFLSGAVLMALAQKTIPLPNKPQPKPKPAQVAPARKKPAVRNGVQPAAQWRPASERADGSIPKESSYQGD